MIFANRIEIKGSSKTSILFLEKNAWFTNQI